MDVFTDKCLFVDGCFVPFIIIGSKTSTSTKETTTEMTLTPTTFLR